MNDARCAVGSKFLEHKSNRNFSFEGANKSDRNATIRIGIACVKCVFVVISFLLGANSPSSFLSFSSRHNYILLDNRPIFHRGKKFLKDSSHQGIGGSRRCMPANLMS